MSHKWSCFVSQLDTGRVRQKERTRVALLEAAREALNEGLHPTVAEVADRAGISRATAYRYFSSPDILLQEAVLDGIAASLDSLDLSQDAADLEQRVSVVVTEIIDMVLRNETLFRLYLRSLLAEPKSAVRGARRLRWIGQAIGPGADDLGERNTQRLTQALSLLAGIETIIVLRDVCGLPDPQIREVAGWTARALVQAALREARPTP
jgi:AcrR family transcriptional regulator